MADGKEDEIVIEVEGKQVQVSNVPARTTALTPMEMLSRALERGADIGILEKLMDLQERHEKNEGRKAFDEAMAAASAEIPVIAKTREVDFTTSKGRTNYRYEDLATIAATVNPILSKHGLSYRFRTTSAINEPIVVTCIVSHRLGYSEENTLSAGRDDSGNKNSIQAIGSTLTYLQRMTLKAALGLAAAADDDAKASESNDPQITEEELVALRTRIDETKADTERLCETLKVDALPDLRQSQLKAANALLDERAKLIAKKRKEPAQ